MLRCRVLIFSCRSWSRWESRAGTNYHAAKSACGTGRVHPAETAIMEVMSKSTSRRFPVTVTRLPVARCQICHRTVAYRPGKASEVLTEHYRRAHPEALERPSR